MNGKWKQQQQLVALTALLSLAILLQLGRPAQAAPSRLERVLPVGEGLFPEESRNEEISDDLSAADLDLEGASEADAAAAASAPESMSEEEAEPETEGEDESADGSNARELRWNGQPEPASLDSNIENAKVRLNARDMATAAGHHHHHGHYVHGWLKMGAETGKKGAFKWHDKHPVGGKGRR